MAKWAQIGSKYYTVGEGSNLQQISANDIVGAGGDANVSIQQRIQSGDLQVFDPSRFSFQPGAMGGPQGNIPTNDVYYDGSRFSLGGSAASVKPGTTAEQFGALPFNQDFSQYLKDTGQTYNQQAGFSGSPTIQSTQQFQQGGQPIQDATLTGQQQGGTFQGREFFRRGGDVFERTATGERPVSFDEFQNKLQGLNLDVLPQEQVSKFQQGFRDATSAGISKIDSPGDAQGIIQQYAPQKQNDFASAFVRQDPFIGNLVTAWQEYIKPDNQRASLAETYQTMIKDSGIEQIDMDIINARNIIEGTEEDIRREITGVGGLATESAVRSLANARNRVLIKDYNTLLATRDAKEKYIQTSLQLEQSDRQAADQRFEQSFNMGLKIADYQQKMRKNAIESFDRTISAIGWSGLANIVTPYEASLIEQAYGLPQNGLQLAAQRELAQRELEAQKAPIEVSPGATLFDPNTGQPIYTAPTARVGGARGDGLTVDTKKLTTSQINEVGDIDTVSSQIDQLLASPIKGAVGFFTGPIESFLFKTLGKGSAQDAQTRAIIGNIKGTLAKLRGGTSFTVNEQKLLDSYVPSIGESAESVIAKATALKSYLAIKKSALTGIQTETIRVRRKSDGQTGTVPSGEFDPELYEKI